MRMDQEGGESWATSNLGGRSKSPSTSQRLTNCLVDQVANVMREAMNWWVVSSGAVVGCATTRGNHKVGVQVG